MNSVLYQFLNEPYNLKVKWMEAENRVEELRASMLPCAMRYDKDRVMASPDDPMIKYAERLEPLERKAMDLFTEYCRSRTQVEEALKVLTHKQRKVMQMKYFSRLSNRSVADALGISSREVMKLCERAYDSLLIEVLRSPLKYVIV